MKCPNCSALNRRGARFCRTCDFPLRIVCSSCGRPSGPDSLFCDSCGSSLADHPPDESRAPTPAKRHSRVRTPTKLEGERKQVSVLFCDIVNSVGLTEELGPELSHAFLGRFFDVIIPEVHRYEGTISQYMGDGFMALYGAPVAHEDHARRALLSALAIRRAVDSGVILPDGRNVPVALRIGVNTGFVIIGKVGNDRSMDFT